MAVMLVELSSCVRCFFFAYHRKFRSVNGRIFLMSRIFFREYFLNCCFRLDFVSFLCPLGCYNPVRKTNNNRLFKQNEGNGD